MTWDILFLLPATWTGPVISPVIVSLTMIIFSLIIFYFNDKATDVRIKWREWTILIFGSLVLITGFIWDYSRFILEKYSFSEVWSLPDNEALFNYAYKYVPQNFNWFLFVAGELIISSGIFVFFRRNKKLTQKASF
jgi:hypothetical protein